MANKKTNRILKWCGVIPSFLLGVFAASKSCYGSQMKRVKNFSQTVVQNSSKVVENTAPVLKKNIHGRPHRLGGLKPEMKLFKDSKVGLFFNNLVIHDIKNTRLNFFQAVKNKTTLLELKNRFCTKKIVSLELIPQENLRISSLIKLRAGGNSIVDPVAIRILQICTLITETVNETESTKIKEENFKSFLKKNSKLILIFILKHKYSLLSLFLLFIFRNKIRKFIVKKYETILEYIDIYIYTILDTIVNANEPENYLRYQEKLNKAELDRLCKMREISQRIDEKY